MKINHYTVTNTGALSLLFIQMVWEHYSQSSAQAGLRAAAYTTFLRYWRELAPHILVMKPMSDLCWLCQKNSSAITKSKNMPDETKSLVSTLYENELCYTYKNILFIGYSSCTGTYHLGFSRAGLLQDCL